MQKSIKILFLTLDGFSKIGGIQSVCKTLSYTLNSIDQKSNSIDCYTLSLHDHLPNTEYIPLNKFKGYKGKKISFSIDAMRKGLSANTIIISHINLILVALMIKVLRKRTKIIMLAHGMEIWKDIPFWKVYFMKKYVKIWAVSQHTKDTLITRHDLISQNIVILNNCLDPFHQKPNNFSNSATLLDYHQLSLTHPILLSVCRMSLFDRNKGYELILHALKKLLNEFPRLKFFMIGSIEELERTRIMLLINQLGIRQSVEMLGLVSESDLIKYYQLADVFVLPSSKEGFGLVFIEAASFGCTVITGNQDGGKEAILKGKLGISIDVSIENLTVEISKVLSVKRNMISRKAISEDCIDEFNQPKYEAKVKTLIQ